MLFITKADLVEGIHIKANISKRDSADSIEEVFSIMKDTLESGEKIKIVGFGNFEVKSKGTRKGRNPISGESIIIEARKEFNLNPRIALKQSINDT